MHTHYQDEVFNVLHNLERVSLQMGSHGSVLRVGVEKCRGGNGGHRLYNAWGQFSHISYHDSYSREISQNESFSVTEKGGEHALRLYLTKEITNFIHPNLLPKIRNMVLKKGGVSKTALRN